MNKILYFAYGSNILTERLTRRVGKVQYYSNHILNNYKLVFNCDGFANIIPSEGDHVEGALYVLTAEQIAKLSRYEALYKMEFFTVDEYTVVVYTGLEEAVYYSHRDTDPKYVDLILEGCLEKGLKNTYNKLVLFKASLRKSGKSKTRRSNRFFRMDHYYD